RVMVMYAGKKLEEADLDTLFRDPRHPYTWGLMASTTRTDKPRLERLHQIAGAPPSLITPPPACRFAPRCAYVQDMCRRDYPDLRSVGHNQFAACHVAERDDWHFELTPERWDEVRPRDLGAATS